MLPLKFTPLPNFISNNLLEKTGIIPLLILKYLGYRIEHIRDEIVKSYIKKRQYPTEYEVNYDIVTWSNSDIIFLSDYYKLDIDIIKVAFVELQKLEIISNTEGKFFKVKPSYIWCEWGTSLQALKNTYNFDRVKKDTLGVRSGWIYLMHQTSTNFYKIGFTINPTIREKTLMAESIDTRFILIKEGTLTDEKNLHKKFQDKRIRGEWFALTENDINYFKSIEFYEYNKTQKAR